MSSAPLFIQVPLQWAPPRALAPLPASPPEREDVARVRAALGAHANEILSGRELIRTAESHVHGTLPTGVAPLDRLLGGGLAKGKLLELTGSRTSGRWSAILAALASVTDCGEPAALVDHGSHFDPQIAEASGVDLERLLWVAPESVRDCVAAAELLMNAGFPLVIVDFGLRLRGRRVPDASWIRLARAADAHGAALVISAPFPLSGTAAEGAIRAGRASPRWSGGGKTQPLLEGIDSRFTVEKHRRMREGAYAGVSVRDAAWRQ